MQLRVEFSVTCELTDSEGTKEGQGECCPDHFIILSATWVKTSRTWLMSQSIPTGYILPPGNPRRLAKKTFPGGRDLTFESCPGAGNSTRTEILWKIKVKLQKIAWIKFLQVKTKNKLNFCSFSRFTCFLNGIFPGIWVNFLVLLSHIPYKKYEELPLACLYLRFSLGYGYPYLLLYKRL